jgi:K+-transporting ATPase ATPase C chain
MQTGWKGVAAAGLAAARVSVATSLVVVVGYTAVVLLLAQVVRPDAAAGSLVRGPDGRVRGSSLLAQGFSQPGYFWPRPSAVGYNASGSGGSNLSPAGAALRARVEASLGQLGIDPGVPVPLDLVTASGSGLDPHLTAAAALAQVPRVASARGLEPGRVRDLVAAGASGSSWPWTGPRLVNVLELNLALDRMAP